MSDTDANDSIVITYLYDIAYSFAHRKNYKSRLDSRKRVCFEICFLVYILLFAVSIIMILTRQLWFIFAFQNGSHAILFLVLILVFTVIIFVSKLQKKRKSYRRRGIDVGKIYEEGEKYLKTPGYKYAYIA